jgi:hypothetical protein
VDLDATLSGYSDPHDKYIITPTTGDPLRVQVTTPADDMDFSVDLIERSTSTYLTGYYWKGSADFMLKTAGAVEHILHLYSFSGETTYNLQVSEAPGYMISGSVLDTFNNPVDPSYVYSPDLDLSVGAGLGTYGIGPFPPGAYDLYCYAPNYESTPPSPVTVSVSNVDVVQNFVFSVNNNDNGEPDGSWAQAHELVSGVPYSANITTGTDTQDWYWMNTGPGLIYIHASFAHWAGPVYMSLFDTDGSTTLATSSYFGMPYQRIDYLLPALGTYYISIWGGSNDYTITAEY